MFTSQALFGYAVGLWAVGGIRITAPAFYAMQDTKTPVIVAFIAFVANAVLGYVLGFKFGLLHTGSCDFKLGLFHNQLSSCSSIWLREGSGDIKVKSISGSMRKAISDITRYGICRVGVLKTIADWDSAGFAVDKIASSFRRYSNLSCYLFLTLAKLLRGKRA